MSATSGPDSHADGHDDATAPAPAAPAAPTAPAADVAAPLPSMTA